MNKISTPDYLFESSWEVCNKIGGIYTVLSTKALTQHILLGDKSIYIGPDLQQCHTPGFVADESLFADWRKSDFELKVKVGRWDIPGNPPLILVDYKPLIADKNSFYFTMWEKFGVNSIHAYGDYDDSCLFAIAVGKVIESFYHFYKLDNKKVVAHFHEWMLGMGLLYTQMNLPAVATVFTTHATSIGRSIAGNNKPLYAYMQGYNGDQMARELNMEAKHSIEKEAAWYADAFTTVSDITANECRQLLCKQPDVVTPNGFEPDFVPDKSDYETKRKAARKCLINVAEKLCGCPISADAMLVSTSGRYEYRNKGIDVFIDAVNRLRQSKQLERDTVAFIMVPAWVRSPRADLQEMLKENYPSNFPMQMPFLTHWMNMMENDMILNYIFRLGFTNSSDDKLKIIFVPCYLDGFDGVFNIPYYDLLIGMDATVYPSYYEPWGYTPLESIAFGIPTITTNLAGFGHWAKKHLSGNNICEGVAVAERNDSNYFEVADFIRDSLLILAAKENKQTREMIRNNCFSLASKAEWSKFITYYQATYTYAMEKASRRCSKRNC